MHTHTVFHCVWLEQPAGTRLLLNSGAASPRVLLSVAYFASLHLWLGCSLSPLVILILFCCYSTAVTLFTCLCVSSLYFCSLFIVMPITSTYLFPLLLSRYHQRNCICFHSAPILYIRSSNRAKWLALVLSSSFQSILLTGMCLVQLNSKLFNFNYIRLQLFV